MNKLTFTKAEKNAKLEKHGSGFYTFSLAAGYSCPGAKLCLAYVKNGRLIDGN